MKIKQLLNLLFNKKKEISSFNLKEEYEKSQAQTWLIFEYFYGIKRLEKETNKKNKENKNE